METQKIAEGYNRQAGWFYKLKSKQNAKGQLSFEIEISGPDEFLIVAKTYELLILLEKTGKLKGFEMSHQPKGDIIED